MSQVSSAKKIAIIIISIFFLSACGQKASVVNYEGPTEGPDFVKMMPITEPSDINSNLKSQAQKSK